MALDPIEVVRRLAYIRYLHSLGIEQARLPDPMSSAALLMFHDAVESFLLMASEHFGAPSIHEFEKYWDALKPSKIVGGVELPVQQGMKRLNRQRVALKHHGSHPNPTTVELIKNDTATFLVTASQLVFGVDYNAVSMSSVIPQEAVRDLVLAADAENTRGDRVEAMIALVDAWEELFHPWPQTKAIEDSSPLRFGPSISRTLTEYEIATYLYNENGSRRHPRRNEDIGRQIAAVTNAVTALQGAARLTAIGVDYTEYLRFRALTPHRDGYMTGQRTYHAPSNYAPSEENVTFCIQFVVTAALRLATAEAQLVEPPWIDGAQIRRAPWEIIKEIRGRED
jgi:hypothetical protein